VITGSVLLIILNSTACCVRRADRQWAAFELGNKTPIVDFGKYNYMWGFDNGYCLVSVADKDRTTFANRGIINEQGEEVVKPYTWGVFPVFMVSTILTYLPLLMMVFL